MKRLHQCHVKPNNVCKETQKTLNKEENDIQSERLSFAESLATFDKINVLFWMMRVKTLTKMLENLQPEDKNQKSIKSYSKSHLFISFEIKRNV